MMVTSQVLAGTAASKPTVFAGLYVNKISSISVKDESFTADITLWFRWTNPKIDPSKTFKLKDAEIKYQKKVFDGLLDDRKTHYAAVDITAKLPVDFNLNNYPFNKQKLVIQVEENEDEDDVVLYASDDANLSKSIHLFQDGWDVVSSKAFISQNRYSTNFGNTSIPNDSSYQTSQFNYEMTIKKVSLLGGLKVLIAPIVAIFLLSMVLLLPAKDGARFEVGTAAIFTLVATYYVLMDGLPESDEMTFAEKLTLFGLI
jgi:hypothetical protein